METLLNSYRQLLGSEPIDELVSIASVLKGVKIVHVNSTKTGGGVAEILSKMIPLCQALGLNVQWEVIEGTADFFQCTKSFHNLLQGSNDPLPDSSLLDTYEKVNATNAEKLKNTLESADIVFIHDPQPLSLITHFPHRTGKWIWRCHIDLSTPSSSIWNYLKKKVELYDGSIFSLKDFAQSLSHPIYIIPPSIDPLSEKNRELSVEESIFLCLKQGIDPHLPYLLQVSRFDRFKDPLGVIEAYRLIKQRYPGLQLVLAGGGAVDDPEGMQVLKEVQNSKNEDPNIHILLLPPDAHRTINALQSQATIILQKSLKEGFGLTVSEALWKLKPVIGGNTGGIRLQIIPGQTGFLVNTPQEAADHLEIFLQNPEEAKEMGRKGKERVKEHFLITRHLFEYLTVMASHLFPNDPRVLAPSDSLKRIDPTSASKNRESNQLKE